MNFIKFISLISILIISYVQAEQISYEGYRLVSLVPKTEEQIKLIAKWENDLDFDIWNSIKGINNPVHVLLSPIAFEFYRIEFIDNELQYKIIQNNVEDLIQEERRSMIKSKHDRNIVGTYASYAATMSFIDNLADEHDWITYYDAGKTFEGRNLRVIKLSKSTTKKAIWIDCGIHAREWISPSTCIYMLNQLIEDYNNGVKRVVSLLNYYEIHMMPIHNPDGYDYTQTNRLWRKNRNTKNHARCVGVDLNRNYGYMWLTGGSSTNPCADNYAGPEKDSELETQAVQESIMAKKGDWDMFITIHSYGNWWFTLWGYTRNDPPNYPDLKGEAEKGAMAIQGVNGRKWTFGSSAQILYIASGGSEDWAYGTANIPYTFCLELRPGQSDSDYNQGFVLPTSSIIPAGKETYEGVLTSMESIKAKNLP